MLYTIINGTSDRSCISTSEWDSRPCMNVVAESNVSYHYYLHPVGHILPSGHINKKIASSKWGQWITYLLRQGDHKRISITSRCLAFNFNVSIGFTVTRFSEKPAHATLSIIINCSMIHPGRNARHGQLCNRTQHCICDVVREVSLCGSHAVGVSTYSTGTMYACQCICDEYAACVGYTLYVSQCMG